MAPLPCVFTYKLNSALLDFAAVGNHDGSSSAATGRTLCFDRFDNIHAFDDTAKDYVLRVQPLCLNCADEKLRAVGVRPSIGHAQHAWSVVGELEVFISKFLTVDAFATCAIAGREVAALDHELRDDAVEAAALKM